jgi:hypothetical protein
VPFHVLRNRHQRGRLGILGIIDTLHDVDVRPIVVGEVFEIRKIVQATRTEDHFGDQADEVVIIVRLILEYARAQF